MDSSSRSNIVKAGKFSLFGYILLLIISWTIQFIYPPIDNNSLFKETKSLTIDGEEFQFEYFELYSPQNNKKVLLLPGFKLDNNQKRLAESISEYANVIIPEYPVNNSGDTLSIYSIEKRAYILSLFLDQVMNDNELHIIGYGHGSLIAAHLLSEFEQSLFSSATLINSVGIEELYFLGNQKINRALFKIYLPLVKTYKYVFPHFGYYYNQQTNIDYVNALINLDQSQAPYWFRNIDIPVLTLHTREHTAIPVQSSIEIHRLVPHSELHVLQQSELVETINSFYVNVERGETNSRMDASEERIKQSELPFNSENIEPISGSALLTILFIIFISVIIHEDITSISSGLLVASGVLELQYAIAICMLGIFVADNGTYLIGRIFGLSFIKRAPLKWVIKKKDIEWAENMFDMKGVGIIFAARFLPGTRLATYFTAGLLKTNYSKFIIYFILAISIWVPFIVGISSVIGQPMLGYIDLYQEYTLLVVLLFVLIIYSMFAIVIPLTTKKGRREFYVKWLRVKEKYISQP